MLETLRKSTQSWFIRILFGILVLSFIIFFGTGDDLLRVSSSRPAIVVGSQSISGREVAEQFQRDSERLQSALQTRLSAEQARDFGILQQAIRQIVTRALLAAAASDLGFTLDDASLRRVIATMPAFLNGADQFDMVLYQNGLRRAGFTEARFLEMLRKDAIRQNVINLVQSGVSVPGIVTDTLFQYRFERRIAETIIVPANKMAIPPKPDEAVLKAYWTEHAEDFTAPETRKIKAVVLRLSDIAAGIKPDEAAIKQIYESRQSEFVTPEKRAVQQVLFENQAEAQAFADSIKSPADFVAAARKSGRTVVDIGLVQAGDLPLATLEDVAFALTAPGVTPPVKSDLGWHVLLVSAIEPSIQEPLDEVRPAIVRELAREEGTDRLFALSTKLEDAIGSGAPIEEAAATLGIPVLNIESLDRQGNDPNGKPATGLPSSRLFLESVFSTAEGASTQVTAMEGDSGYFVLQVEKVTPPALKPFGTVEGEVLAAWNQEQRRIAAREMAKSLSARLEKGEAASTVAKGYAHGVTAPFLRAPGPNGKDTSPILAAAMFKSVPGEIAVIDLPEASVVARLKEIVPANAAADREAYFGLNQQLTQSFAEDMLQEYLSSLQETYGVTIRPELIQRHIDGL